MQADSSKILHEESRVLSDNASRKLPLMARQSVIKIFSHFSFLPTLSIPPPMRTKLTIAALFLLGTTGAYALVAHLFPNTVDFPRIPTGPGTIGNILTKFFGPNLDGTGDAPNTLALS